MSGKKYSYDLARNMNIVTFIVFATQLMLEVSGVVNRTSGYEYTTHVCFGLFIMSTAFSMSLIIANAIKRKTLDNKE